MEPSHVSVIAIYPAELDPEVASINNVMHLQHKPQGVSREGGGGDGWGEVEGQVQAACV